MKAIVRDRYGSPDVLRLEDVPTPTPAENEVLVKVHAAAVNKGDWEILHGSPLWVRLAGFGVIRPKIRILGSNFAGRIEAVGSAVSQFVVGDEICGDILMHGLGAFAEFVCVPEDAALVRKPDSLSFESGIGCFGYICGARPTYSTDASGGCCTWRRSPSSRGV